MTESGIFIEFRLEHPSNAELPILVTESGIVIEVRLVQLMNAALAISFVPGLISYDVIDLSLHFIK